MVSTKLWVIGVHTKLWKVAISSIPYNLPCARHQISDQKKGQRSHDKLHQRLNGGVEERDR